jgi:hypothetical protein
VRWKFKGKTPAWAYVLTVLLLVNAVLQIAAAYWISSRAPVEADPVHSFPVRFRGGPTFFVQPWLGAYNDYGFYAGLVLLGLVLLLLWLNRDQLERTG